MQTSLALANFIKAIERKVSDICRWNAKNNSWDVTAALRPMIVNLDFQKGGKTVYKAVQYAGYVGIITGLKPVNLAVVSLFLK